MKKYSKIMAKYILCTIMILSLSVLTAYANESIKSIDVNVVINNDGSANVTQVWDIYTQKGTEFYIPMTNMGDMQVVDFKVKDETGKVFTFIEKWDVNASLEEKAYKNGFNPTGEGFEMCWGKGSYGSHTYTLTYKLTNLVKSYEDSDGFLSRFVNDQMSPWPDGAKVTISLADGTKLTEENSQIWSFGNNGDIQFVDGKIVADSRSKFGYDTHMTIMVGLNKEIVKPVSKGDGLFSDLQDRAFEGSDYGSNNAFNDFDGGPSSIVAFFSSIILAFPFIIFGAVLTITIVVSKSKTFYRLQTQYAQVRTRRSEIDYFRDLPMDNQLETTFYGLRVASVMAKPENLISAYILDLIRDGAIVPEKEEKEGFFHFRDKIFFRIDRSYSCQGYLKNQIFSFIKKAADDNVLEEKEMKTWARKNYKKFEEFFKKLEEMGERKFREIGGFELVQKKNRGKELAELTDRGKELLEETIGFKKYLEDFTLLNERDMIEVEIWDDYLIYASMFGIADKVAKEMNALYPEFESQSSFSSARTGSGYGISDTILFSSMMNRTLYSGYSSATSASRSSGGGGGASFGGGGGFSGGGSGGGSR